MGQDLWEAVYVGIKGGNYGWSVTEAGHHFKPGPPGAQYNKPVVDYAHKPNLMSQAIFPDHGIGLCVIGGYVYHGKDRPRSMAFTFMATTTSVLSGGCAMITLRKKSLRTAHCCNNRITSTALLKTPMAKSMR